MLHLNPWEKEFLDLFSWELCTVDKPVGSSSTFFLIYFFCIYEWNRFNDQETSLMKVVYTLTHFLRFNKAGVYHSIVY